MTDITIPPEALKAAAKELYEVHPYTDEDDDVIPWEELYMIDKEEYLDFARSACLAMLKAWPGMVLHPGTHISPACVRLPVADGGTVWVTQEKPNDKG